MLWTLLMSTGTKTKFYDCQRNLIRFKLAVETSASSIWARKSTLPRQFTTEYDSKTLSTIDQSVALTFKPHPKSFSNMYQEKYLEKVKQMYRRSMRK